MKHGRTECTNKEAARIYGVSRSLSSSYTCLHTAKVHGAWCQGARDRERMVGMLQPGTNELTALGPGP